jgi:hypothetical protein
MSSAWTSPAYREAEDAYNGDFWSDECSHCGCSLRTDQEREAGECRECGIEKQRREEEGT